MLARLAGSMRRLNEMRVVIIFGARGVGKSTYAIKELYRYYGDWGKALDNIAFSIEDLLEKSGSGGRGRSRSREFVVWDDAGVWGSTYLWFTEGQKLLAALFDYMDTARLDFNLLALTTPSLRKIPPAIRLTDGNVIIKIVRSGYSNGVKVARANWYTVSEYIGKNIIKKVGRENFRVRLPDPVYQEYLETRRYYTAVTRHTLRERIREHGELLERKPR